MSTAGRATYQAAKGSARSSTINTQKVSGRDQTAHTKLKYRQIGQSSKDELKNKNLKDDLEGREHKYLLSNNKETKWMVKEEEKKVDVNTILSEKPKINFEEVQKKYDDADIDVNDSDDESESEKDDDTKSDNDNKNRKGDSVDDDSSSDDDDDDDDEDEEALLQVELERIREERALAQARKEQEEREFQEKIAQEQALRSNPLLNMDDKSGRMKRRWNDDVIFRNQAKDEPEYKKRFINDTIRSDFHRAFLKRYIR